VGGGGGLRFLPSKGTNEVPTRLEEEGTWATSGGEDVVSHLVPTIRGKKGRHRLATPILARRPR